MNQLEPIYTRHGFETLVTFTLITERALGLRHQRGVRSS